jgi:hypothetical protein
MTEIDLSRRPARIAEKLMAEGMRSGLEQGAAQHPGVGLSLVLRAALRAVVDLAIARLGEARALELVSQAIDDFIAERKRQV